MKEAVNAHNYTIVINYKIIYLRMRRHYIFAIFIIMQLNCFKILKFLLHSQKKYNAGLYYNMLQKNIGFLLHKNQ